jgi:hypothetical protein
LHSKRKRKGLKFKNVRTMPLKKRDLKESPQKDFTFHAKYFDVVEMMSDKGSQKEQENEKDQKDINVA